MKNKHHWEIDDMVFFLDGTNHYGEFPKIAMGYIEEITRTHLRIRLTKNKASNLLIVAKSSCYKDLEALCFELRLHLDAETKRLTGRAYQ